MAELVWVFAYGSLMWAPGHAPDHQAPATLHGHRRAMCLLSHKRWGTTASPGLVMGLLPGDRCVGRALGYCGTRWEEVRAYLRDREGPAYRETSVTIALELDSGPTSLSATTFVADPTHPLSAVDIDLAEAATLVAEARGAAGSSYDYLRNTLEGLQSEGVVEPELERLLAAANRLRQSGRP